VRSAQEEDAVVDWRREGCVGFAKADFVSSRETEGGE
jgi:hypothetical protein